MLFIYFICLFFSLGKMVCAQESLFCQQMKPCGTYPCESGTVGGVTFFICNCATGFQGMNISCPDPNPLCNPLCKNGGKCNDGKCTCPQPYTGLSCETIIISQKKCDTITNLCQNGGTCRNDDSNSDGYVCECTNEYTGKNCEQIQENVCIRSKPCGDYKCEWLPRQSSYICYCENSYLVLNRNCSVAPTCSKRCQNGGYCSLDSDFKTSCICLPGFIGEFCEIEVTVVTSPCDTGNPCRNDGTCVKVGLISSPSNFYCTCQPDYTGFLCEFKLTDSCTDITCKNGGTCSSTSNGFVCSCTTGYSGTTCEFKEEKCSLTFCNGNGLCSEGDQGPYCLCFMGFIGENCQTIDRCKSGNPCQNEATCLNDDTTLTGIKCLCPPKYTGLFCDKKSECDANTCNGVGICQNGPSGPSCACQVGYIGEFCEKRVCDSVTCLNDGTCVSANNIFGYICNCKEGFTGQICDSIIPSANLCVDLKPCLHDGICQITNNIEGYTCVCKNGFTGKVCEIIDIITPGPCDRFNPCQNNGICKINNEIPVGFSCECLNGFSGPFCEFSSLSACFPVNPCLNGGSCNVADNINGFICSCVKGFTGDRCESNAKLCDLTNPCLNNGTCVNLDQPYEFICKCADGYSGILCADMTLSPCDRFNPCLNDGSCINSNQNGVGYICNCRLGYFGSNCEHEINPCDRINLCKNQGKCINSNTSPTGFICQCQSGTHGLLCENNDFCTASKCLNGGFCFETQKNCKCKGEFLGDLCQYENKLFGNFQRFIDCNNPNDICSIYVKQFDQTAVKLNGLVCNTYNPCNSETSKCIDLQFGTIDFTRPTHLCLCNNNGTIGFPSCRHNITHFSKKLDSHGPCDMEQCPLKPMPEEIKDINYCSTENRCRSNSSVCLELPWSVKVLTKIPYLCLCNNGTAGYPYCHKSFQSFNSTKTDCNHSNEETFIEYQGQMYNSKIIESLVGKWISMKIQKSFQKFLHDLDD